MSDEPTIQPALTADEWREFLDPANKEWAPLVYHNLNNHAAAATGLHGQPFGFTADDVAALRALSDMDLHERSCATSGKLPFPCDCDVPERIMALESIADRIAALLPPTP